MVFISHASHQLLARYLHMRFIRNLADKEQVVNSDIQRFQKRVLKPLKIPTVPMRESKTREGRRQEKWLLISEIWGNNLNINSVHFEMLRSCDVIRVGNCVWRHKPWGNWDLLCAFSSFGNLGNWLTIDFDLLYFTKVKTHKWMVLMFDGVWIEREGKFWLWALIYILDRKFCWTLVIR